MVAHLQRLTTLGSLGFLAIWVTGFWQRDQPGLATAGAIALALSYTLVLAIEFILVHRIHGSDPAPKATVAQLLRAWIGEALIAPTVFCWNQPFRSRRHPDFLPPASRNRGVILVSGYLCNRGFWNRWMPRLKRHEVPHIALSLEPVFGSISAYAESIDDAVRRMAEATGRTPVLVGHSMGGLAIRAWLHQSKGLARIHHVVTIGSPHHGTWLARFAMSRNAGEMARDSAWRREIESTETPAQAARFTCFYSHCDNIVFPASTASLPHADNRHLEGMAHIHLSEHPAVLDEVLQRVSPLTTTGPAPDDR
jgi:triacylglycerol lipase